MMVDWRQFGPGPVIGVDEVGRGCLAGPVVAAAIFFNNFEINEEYKDSKLLSPKKRKELSLKAKAEHLSFVASATVEEIDQINILNASLLAMKRAVDGLIYLLEGHELQEVHVLVDGNQSIPNLKYEQSCLIQGDRRCSLIAAASIVAKVHRDDWMVELDEKFPQYLFKEHKGYSVPRHKEAIQKWGPTPHHRRTFAGVKEHLQF